MNLVLKLSLAILNSSKEAKKKKPAAEKLIKIALKSLNENQQQAADLLLKKVAEEKFSTILLDGITGSGKTEVYFQAIASSLRGGNGFAAIQDVNKKDWIASSALPPRNDGVRLREA